MDATLRLARPTDAAAIRRIYAPYVEETAITFATTAPSTTDLEAKVEQTLAQFPWVVAEQGSDGRDAVDGDGGGEDDPVDGVVGYAYAGPLRKREAYQWTTELSVYVDEPAQGAGLGRWLYEALLALLERQGYASAYGVVTLPNPPSVALHESMGFEKVGHFDNVGYKQGAWHEVGWWRFSLPSPSAPDPPTPIRALPERAISAVLSD